MKLMLPIEILLLEFQQIITDKNEFDSRNKSITKAVIGSYGHDSRIKAPKFLRGSGSTFLKASVLTLMEEMRTVDTGKQDLEIKIYQN